jgi:hypothetical protein
MTHYITLCNLLDMYCPKRGVTGITQSPIKGKEGQDELGDACENIRLLYHSTAMPQVTPIQRRLSSTTVANTPYISL